MLTKTIIARCFTPIEDEYTAGGTITPGMLLEVNSSGNVIAHNSAGQNHERKFALEDINQGRGVNDDYDATIQTKVRVGTFRAGDRVWAILADGSAYTKGMFLESAGDGTLQPHVADADVAHDSDGADPLTTSYTQQIVGRVCEDLDLSSSSGAESQDSSGTGYNKRVRIEII